MLSYPTDPNHVLAIVDGTKIRIKDALALPMDFPVQLISFDKSIHCVSLIFSCLIHSHSFFIYNPNWPGKYIDLYRELLKKFEFAAPSFFIPTSGSTGVPKLVCHSMDSLTKSAKRSLAHLSIASSQCFLLSLSPVAMGGLLTFVKSLVTGIPLIIHSVHWSNALMINRSYHLAMVPQQLKQLISKIEMFSSSMSSILIGGDGVGDVLKAQCKALNLPVLYSYGLTETCGQIVSTSFTNSQYQPLKNIVLDRHEKRLLIGCDTLAQGYLTADGLRPLPRKGDLFLTNDIVELFPNFKFIGRVDKQFQSGAQLINPQFIETELLKSGLMEHAIVIPREDDKFGFVPTVYVPKGTDLEQLQSFIDTNLPVFLQPKTLLFFPDGIDFKDLNCRYLLSS